MRQFDCDYEAIVGASAHEHASEQEDHVVALSVAERLRVIDEAEVIVEEEIVTAEVAIPDSTQ